MVENYDNSGSQQAYPSIADKVFTAVNIPYVPFEVRNKFIRPDTCRIYVPDRLKRDKDHEEEERKNKRRRCLLSIMSKRINKVINKNRSDTGEVTYKVVWTDNQSESVPASILHDHPDWYKVEQYEHLNELPSHEE